MGKVNQNNETNKYHQFFMLFCCLAYFTSYVTRINFGAVVAEIVAAENIAKSAISVVLTVNAISYGVGQLFSGVLGDLVLPEKLILTGFLVTAGCNLAMPFCHAVAPMAVVWFINGFAQAMMWPPLVKLITRYLEGAQYSRTMTNVIAASSVGTVFVYLIAPFLIRLESWRSVFYFSGAMALIVSVIWAVCLPKILERLIPVTAKQQVANAHDGMSVWEIFKKYGLIMICIAIAAQGAVRDGVTNWLPSCVSEVFHMEAASSILVSVILPVLSIGSIKLAGWIQQKWVQNEVRLAAYMFVLCVLLLCAWSAVYNVSLVLSVLLPAVAVGLIHGINLMLVCTIPKRFAGGKVSTISGVLNFCTYVGSAASTYGLARVSEIAGWQTTIWCWVGCAVLGLVLCTICLPRFQK